MPRSSRFVLTLSALLACERPAPAPAPPAAPAPAPPAAPAPALPAAPTPALLAPPAAPTPAPLAPPAPRDGTAGSLAYVEFVTGAARPDAALPLVIAIHGLGDDPHRFGALFTALDVPARVIAVRGLDPWGEGYAWFPPRVSHGVAELAPLVRRAADAIATAIPLIARDRPTCGRAIVTGFSQGGMLSYAVAALHPASVALALPMSGYLPDPLVPVAHPSGPLAPIHAMHGDADGRIPISLARASIAQLRARGFTATLQEYPGVGHTVSVAMRADLASALRAAVAHECPQTR